MPILQDTTQALEWAERIVDYQRAIPISGPRWPDTIGWVFDRVQAVFRTLNVEAGPLRGVDPALDSWFAAMRDDPDLLELQRVVRASEVQREKNPRVTTPPFWHDGAWRIPTVTGSQEGPQAYGRPLQVFFAHFEVSDESQADWVFAPGTRLGEQVVLDVLQGLVDRWRAELLPAGQLLVQSPHDLLMRKANGDALSD